MTVDELSEYCLLKKKAILDYPFGDIPICFKVGNRLFAQLYPYPDDYKITLKCEPMVGDFYRSQYPGVVVRGYHCPPAQQPYWNTIYLSKAVSDDELKKMIDHAYEEVFNKLPKRVQSELNKT